MDSSLDALERSQAAAARTILVVTLALAPLVAGTAFLAGGPILVATAISSGFAAAAFAAHRAGGGVARIGAAQGLVGQAIALTAAFQGHPWQIDSHMAFFAALAALVAMTDIRALLFGAATIVVHHLSLSLVLPGLIYPGGDILGNVQRTLMHGAIVAAETAALVQAIRIRTRMEAEGAARQAELVTAMDAADSARRTAEAARHEAIRDREAAERAMADADAAQRRAEQQRVEREKVEATAREAEAREAGARKAASEAQHHVVDTLTRALNALSDGDLTARIAAAFPAEYEALRSDFNGAVDRLATAIGAVTGHAAEIRQESSALTRSSDDLSVRTERQAAALEETAAALNELTASVESAARMAESASSQANGARLAAAESGEIVARAIDAMDGIRSSSEKIARITGVIDEIAFQTNLLALNAGVEAARAGDAGRGFAVVASEVRALAQRSSDAAKEINELIVASGTQVGEGVRLVGETGEALSGIVQSVNDAASQIDAIAVAVREQTNGLSEVTSSANELDRVTQQNAAMVQGTSAASAALDASAAALSRVAAQFRLPEAASGATRSADVAEERRRPAA